MLIVVYQRYGTAHRSHLQKSSSLDIWIWSRQVVVPKCR